MRAPAIALVPRVTFTISHGMMSLEIYCPRHCDACAFVVQTLAADLRRSMRHGKPRWN